MSRLKEINDELWKLANNAEQYTPDNMRIAIQDICNDLSEVKEANEWISVEDGFPDSSHGIYNVLYISEEGYQCIQRVCKYMEPNFLDDILYEVVPNVTHYMLDNITDNIPEL